MFNNVLKFLLFIENFQIFENFYPLFCSLDRFLSFWTIFGLIYDVGDLF